MAAAYNYMNGGNSISVSDSNSNNMSSVHQSISNSAIDDEDRVCRSCHSQNLRVDWAQGDRVCTDCGVVDEAHVLDDRPEWKDFGEAEDLVKGLPSGARSGLVVVDESKYLGGLQPTVLSKQVFGNCPMQGAGRIDNIRKSLSATNRKMDRYMEKEQKRALQRAKLSLLLKRKRIDVGDECDVRPEHDAFLLQEEEESQRAHSALFREKWSLHRALLLHGHDLDESNSSEQASILEERAELAARLDKALKRASYDLYTAYTILQHAAQRLELPPRILQHASNTLCRYAAQKDGLTVKGVASRISENSTATAASAGTNNGSAANNNYAATAAAAAAAQLKNYNRQKQMAALASAILFVDARKHGHVRPLQEVCAAFQYPEDCNVNKTSNGDGGGTSQNNFIKTKHCSKAMKELRVLFPEYMRATAAAAAVTLESSSATVPIRSDNFVERATRKLELPPVATASIQILVEELQGKVNESTKMSTTCAAVTLLVCMAGAVMQRLARQAMDTTTGSTVTTKRLKTGDDSNHGKLGTSSTESGMEMKFKHETSSKGSRQKFDMFLHPATAPVANVPSYEMRQMWDAWAEQMPWGRSLAALEQAFHISKPTVLEFFKTKIYPQRVELLSLLQESTKLRSTPRATVLLSQMCSTASPLLNSQGKVV